MMKIDAILRDAEESYISKITRLEHILMPFAINVVGRNPYYAGFEVEQLQLGKCLDGDMDFLINTEVMASYNIRTGMATVLGCKPFKLKPEDQQSVEALIVRLYQDFDNECVDPVEALLQKIASSKKT